MTGVWSELAAVGFFIVTGWIALWPARRDLGVAAFHAISLPAGLLAAPLAAAVSTVTGRPLDALSACAGAVLLIAGARASLGPNNRSSAATREFPASSFAVAAGVTGVLAAAFGAARLTVSNYDSMVSYWPLGVELSRHGAYTGRLLAARNALLPSMNAVHATFGSDWAYVVYPMLGAALLLWVAASLGAGPLRQSSSRSRALVVVGAVSFLLVDPAFLFHSFFVHSHMASAIYLLMALTCLWIAAERRSETDCRTRARPYLVLAGGLTAGLALARPDGLAYQFVVVACAIAVLTVGEVRWREVGAYFAPLLLVEVAVFGSAFVALGVWESNKLNGTIALAMLVLVAACVAVPKVIERLDRALPMSVSGEAFLGIVVAGAAALAIAVYVLKWQTARLALANARINLFEGEGGYNYLWYAVAILLVMSLLTRDALRAGSWTRSAFLAIVLFMIVAAVIHGASHEGRLGVGDSLNRVAFHVIPLVVWYGAAIVARIGMSGNLEGR